MTTSDEQRIAALELLAEASAAVAESLEYEETLQRIARAAIPQFADVVLVYLMDDPGEFRRHEMAAREPSLEEKIRAFWQRFPPDNTRFWEVVESGEPWREDAVGEETWAYVEDPERRRMVMDIGLRSLLCVPMAAAGHSFGALLFARVERDQPFSDFQVEIAQQLGQRAASAIDRSRIYIAEREQRARLEHLQTLTEALASAMTTEEACDAVIREMRDLVGARVVVIGVVTQEGSELEILRTAGVSDEMVARYRRIPMALQLPLTTAIRTGEGIWLGTRAEAVEHSALFRDIATDSSAWAAIPLVVADRVIGALGLSFNDEQPFPEDVRAFILSMAHQTAQALERARLFESERRARREAEHVSRSKDEFLAVLSHELRTPLTTVLGWADLLKMTYQGPDESIRFAVESLRASAATQARLIDDLLDVSRIVTGKLSIEKRPCELTEVVRIAAESMRLSSEKKGVILEVDAFCCVDIDADPARIHQMITNLVGNAIKFTPPGGRITVAVRRHDEEADIIVCDTGIGVAPDFLPHVFERFRQASIGDSRTHSGLGLGLSIVQHLAQLHGGRVRAESEGMGKGSTFTVTLPIKAGQGSSQ